jgi:hypothetical protein
VRGLAGAVWLGITVALVSGPSAAAQLPPTQSPLPGSTFQGADGNQDDAAPLVDWQSLEAAGRVQHNPDANAVDTEFAGGSELLRPETWGLTFHANGVAPATDNIRDAWSAVDQPGADTFLYLGFTRQATSGTTSLSFELNHDDRLWDNGKARIPCRTTGDLLVSYEPHGNDPFVDVVIRRWTTTDWDEGTGCATAGRLTLFAARGANPDAQAAMNSVPVASRLPGALQETLAAGRFGEASLNLTRLLQEAFDDDCLAFGSIWLHSRSSTSPTAAMKDYVAPRALSVRTCAASGVKFFDSNANGERDPGEPGIPRFLIWADYDDDGKHDDFEPFSVSDDDGRYVIHDIRPPDGTYWLRERLLEGGDPVATGWICSHPAPSARDGRFPCAWGPIDAASTPNAEGRDFGNWFPARLTLEKRLFPGDDPGRFDLSVDGEVVVPAAGDGARATVSRPPGTYDVAESPAAGTDPAGFTTTVSCRIDPPNFGTSVRGAASASLPLAAGEHGSCTFYNVRSGAPAIAIRKRGPALAVAGERLRYELQVTNPGFVAFPAAAVSVTDPRCEDPPRLVSKSGDATPGTLDPGDRWTYRCSTATSAGADCEPTTLRNTGTASATVGGTTVTDEDSIATILLCPDSPEPQPPQPSGGGDPDEPGPVAPAGPKPPRAGDAAVARLQFRRATRRCLRTRIPRVHLSGTRISRIRIYVNGRLRRGLNLRTLQRRHRPRVTLAPGRYRVTARVRFQRGSGTPPVTLTRTVRICGRATAPRFTG